MTVRPAMPGLGWGGANACAGALSCRRQRSAGSIAADGIVLGRLIEEDLPPAQMPSVTPEATPSNAPAPQTQGSALPASTTESATPSPGSAQAASPIPPAPSATPTQAAVGAPAAPSAPVTPAVVPSPGAVATAGAGPAPPVPGGATGALPASPGIPVEPSVAGDPPLAPLIAVAEPGALQTSLELTARARQALEDRAVGQAIRTLGSALSVDPTDAYAYFYLGRAYLQKQNYAQALVFLRRAEQGLRSRLNWYVLVKVLEGVCYEFSLKEDTTRAIRAYQEVLSAAPDNAAARAGLDRLTGAPPSAAPAQRGFLSAAPREPAAAGPPAAPAPGAAPAEPPPSSP